MKCFFRKYSGCGNDFILVDNRTLFFPTENKKLIAQLCHRQLGIGADGLILLEHSSICDFKMRIFNSDASEAEMCGNGIRCLAQFIIDCGESKKNFSIQTLFKNLNASIEEDGISIEMGDPEDVRWDLKVDQWQVHHLDTGVPHAVIFVDDLQNTNVHQLGGYIRHHSIFKPRGTNANFVALDKNSLVHVRTFERGVENETLACGTGVVATALTFAKKHHLQSPVSVKVRSGDILKVSFIRKNNSFTEVKLKGPASFIFKGQITA